MSTTPNVVPVAWVNVANTDYGPYEFRMKELLPSGKTLLFDHATIDALQARIVELEKDAARWRWLQDQHEGVEINGLDADGVMLPATVREIGFSVFMPDPWGHEAIVPVPIGNLEETIDAAIKASK